MKHITSLWLLVFFMASTPLIANNPGVVLASNKAANDCKMKTLFNFFPEYCLASTTTEDEFIQNVLCGTINNSSGWQGGVADYTDLYAEIDAGSSEAIIVTNGNPRSSDKVICWVDWDMSYTFDEGNEKFVLTCTGGGTTFTGAIAVPAGTPDGEYRMRVRMSYSMDPFPCETMTYGEVEDYTIAVGGVAAAGPAPTNFEANYVTGTGVFTSWGWGPPPGWWLRWDDGENWGSLGLEEPGTFWGAARWEPADLFGYDGQYITEVNLFPILYQTIPDIKLMIWEGAGFANLVYEQVLTGLSFDEWNTVTLTEAHMIDASTELMVGFEITHVPGEYPLGYDIGPAVAGKGDLVSLDGITFVSMATEFEINKNFNIGIYVAEEVDGMVGTKQILARNTVCNPSAKFVIQTQKVGGANLADGSRAFLGCNVYRDGVKVNADLILVDIYTDVFFTPGTYTYYVKNVYTNGLSDPSNPVEVIIGVGPQITVIPVELTEFHPEWDVTTQMLTITNTGSEPLDWSIVANAPLRQVSIPASDPVEDLRILRERMAAEGLRPLAGIEPGIVAGVKHNSGNSGSQALPFDIFVTSVSQFSNDVGVYSIPQPLSGVSLTNAEPIAITIKNFGTASQSNIPWTVNWDGSTGSGSENGTFAGPLASEATATVNLTQTANLSNYGSYNFTASTALAGDEDAANDCKMKTLFNFFPEYCVASTITEDEFIHNVLCGTIDNSSGWQGDVADYTDIYTVISPGASNAITVTNGNPWASDKVTCWVDWDMSYTFDEGNEKFVLTSDDMGLTFTGAIAVPAETPIGEYRMRVRMTYSLDPFPCETMTYGEVEDYTIKVAGNPIAWLTVPENTGGTLGVGESTGVEITFTSMGLPYGYYAGSLEITSNDTANPLVTVPVTLLVGSPFPPPNNLEAEIINFLDVNLTWDVPTGVFIPEWITYSGENITNAISASTNFDVAARWTPADLAAYPGGSVTKVDFVPGEPDDICTYTIKIWQGSTNPTLKYSQLVTTVTADVWNTIVLNEVYHIDPTQELWIGFNCSAAGGFPAGCDTGPQDEGFGNMISWNGTWTTLSQWDPSLTFNWAVKGYIETGMQVEGYKVFRKDDDQGSFNLIGSTNANILTYLDQNVIYGHLYYYHVKAQYAAGLSAPSNEVEVCIISISDPSVASGTLQVYPNPANDHIIIQSEDELRSVTLNNYSGQVNFSREVKGTELRINTEKFAKGLYMLQIETTDGRSLHKVVIQ